MERKKSSSVTKCVVKPSQTAILLSTLTTVTSSRPTPIKESSITSARPKQLKLHFLMAFRFSNLQISKLKSTTPTERKLLRKYLTSFLTFFNRFPDGTVKSIYPNGIEESVFTDGTIQRIDPNQTKTIMYANGQIDVV